MDNIVSGIRSTGNLHIGNYFGAVKNFIKLQDKNHCFFFIADYHSLTTHPTSLTLYENSRNVLVEYLAAGIDPEKSTIYLQSNVPETTELYLFLNMNAYLGELERSTSFKEKVRSQPDNVNAGLLTYPTLMAADILIHKATKVPVGKDQEQHLEMTRTFANRFNRLYQVDFFKEPQAYNFGGQLVKVPGLDGTGKMSKSARAGNAIFLRDTPEEITRKIKKAKSDEGPRLPGEPKSEATSNLFQLLSLVGPEETLQYFEDQHDQGTIRYGEMKNELTNRMIEVLAPIRERIMEIDANQVFIREVARLGAAKARLSAQETLQQVRSIIGFKSF